MDERLLVFAVIVGAGATLMAVLIGQHDRKKRPSGASIRRGAGNALLGLQQFIEPSVEQILQAQNVEQKDEDDDQGQGGDEEAIQSGLAEALGRTPIDAEEIRRHLTAANRLGLDWRSLFDEAVADELRERPFRAPSMPPANRVAPRE